MLIADRAGIFADCDQASIPARNAAGGGRGEEGLRGGKIGKIKRGVDLNVAEAQRRVDVVNIDAACIRSVPYGARILASDAARGGRALLIAL